jgi:hypothetical protein
MTNKPSKSVALLLALAAIDVLALEPPKRKEDDLTDVPLDELEFGPNGPQRKQKPEAK